MININAVTHSIPRAVRVASNRTNASTLKEVVAPLLFAGVGRQMDIVQGGEEEDSRSERGKSYNPLPPTRRDRLSRRFLIEALLMVTVGPMRRAAV